MLNERNFFRTFLYPYLFLKHVIVYRLTIRHSRVGTTEHTERYIIHHENVRIDKVLSLGILYVQVCGSGRIKMLF